MVGNQDTDIFIFQFPYNLLDVFYSNRVDTGKWFVKHDEFRVNGKATCDFRTTAFAAGQLVTLVLAHLLQTEFCYQTFELFLLILFRLVGHLEHSSNIVFHTHLAEYGGFLCKVSDSRLCPFVNRIFGNLQVVEEDTAFIRGNQPDGHIE